MMAVLFAVTTQNRSPTISSLLAQSALARSGSRARARAPPPGVAAFNKFGHVANLAVEAAYLVGRRDSAAPDRGRCALLGRFPV
jgi:hypothetical protein